MKNNQELFEKIKKSLKSGTQIWITLLETGEVFTNNIRLMKRFGNSVGNIGGIEFHEDGIVKEIYLNTSTLGFRTINIENLNSLISLKE